MNRRAFIAGLGGAAASITALAQQSSRMRRVAILIMYDKNDPAGQLRPTAFQQRLDSLGWSPGRNVQVDVYWGVGDLDWAKSTAIDLLKQVPDVALANGDPAAQALRHLTNKVPIVFIGSSDPVAQGYVDSLAHPGGNMTGFTVLETSVGPKWIDLLKEVAPQVTKVAVLFIPDNSGSVLMSTATVQGAAKFSVDALASPIRVPADRRAVRIGLELCPAEVGPMLRLPYLEQPVGESLHVAMRPVSTYDGEPTQWRRWPSYRRRCEPRCRAARNHSIGFRPAKTGRCERRRTASFQWSGQALKARRPWLC